MNSSYWIKNIMGYIGTRGVTTTELIHIAPLLKNYKLVNILANTRMKSENKIEKLQQIHIASFYGQYNLDLTFEVLEMLLDSNIIYFDKIKSVWKSNLPKELSSELGDIYIKKKVIEYIKGCYEYKC